MLVVGTGLLLASFLRLARVDPGFHVEDLLTAEVSLPEARYPIPEDVASFYRTLTEELERQPGIRSAAATVVLPLTGSYTHVFTGAGEWEAEPVDAEDRLVTSAYFRTMGIPIVDGRDLEPGDGIDTPPLAILNEALAGRVFPGERAVGKRIKFAGADDSESLEVVGVVGDTRDFGLRATPPPILYRPHAQDRPASAMGLVVRGEGPPADLARTLRAAVTSLDSELPVSGISPMEDILAGSVASDRVLLFLVSVFALLALTLCSVGIFGVMSYTVSCRTQEIGVRMAVGGAPKHVLKMIVRQGMALASLGIVIGLVGSLAVGRALSGVLFGVAPNDPRTLLAVVGLITLVALGACFLPARRASAVDPAVSLREE
jgi:putative ABC transport system permease protein